VTDLMPQAEQVCTAKKHGRSNHAWANGCRHPEAVAAHERVKERNRRSNVRLPAQLDANGNCIAEKHGSARAYRRGCRCSEAIAKNQQATRQERTGAPPWKYWRGADARVYRWNLFLAVHGFCGEPLNRGEMMAAVHLLMKSPNSNGTGLKSVADVASTLRVHRADVWKATENIRRCRADRDLRRLADVKLREHRRRIAVAAGREYDRSGHKPRPGAGSTPEGASA